MQSRREKSLTARAVRRGMLDFLSVVAINTTLIHSYIIITRIDVITSRS